MRYNADMTDATFDYEEKQWKAGYGQVCGIDEVGRGCFAGPIVAAGVIFPANITLPKGLRDSKLLSAKKRQELDKLIRELALEFQIIEIGLEVINKHGIGYANKLAFSSLVRNFSQTPDFLLVDAFVVDDFPKDQQQSIIHGDQLSASIAAASIIAKVYRDKLMEELDQKFPGYGLAKNKGYGTKDHRDAIKTKGLSPLHRTSFSLDKYL